MYTITTNGQEHSMHFDRDVAEAEAGRLDRSRKFRVVRIWHDGRLLFASDGVFPADQD